MFFGFVTAQALRRKYLIRQWKLLSPPMCSFVLLDEGEEL